jgi:hypothetical protein
MVPSRFTKHVMKASVMDPESLQEALLSYMREYAYDKEKFKFWLSIYATRDYDLSLLDERESIIMERCGLEKSN